MLQTSRRRVFGFLHIFEVLRSAAKLAHSRLQGRKKVTNEDWQRKPKAKLVNKLRDCFWAGGPQKRSTEGYAKGAGRGISRLKGVGSMGHEPAMGVSNQISCCMQ